MSQSVFQLHQTVQQVLSQHPKTRTAFVSLKTQCSGCYLARFCSLQDVANAYEIAPQALLEELWKAAGEAEIH